MASKCSVCIPFVDILTSHVNILEFFIKQSLQFLYAHLSLQKHFENISQRVQYGFKHNKFYRVFFFLLANNVILFINNILRYIYDCGSTFMTSILSCIYIISTIFLVIMVFLFAMEDKATYKKKIIIIIVVIFIIIVPLLSPLVIKHNTLNTIKYFSNKDKINYIIDFVHLKNEYISDINWMDLRRITSNLYNSIKIFNRLFSRAIPYLYYVTGVGRCGEVADLSLFYLSNSNVSCRKVGLPGEDHEFFEVYYNGSWRVYDLGYSIMNNVTRSYRAEKRIDEMGSISYVEGYDVNGAIDLTSEYVNSDHICIKIVNSYNESLRDVKIELKHKFRGSVRAIPARNTFITGSDGVVSLYLGDLNYSKKAQLAENYFWVFIDGFNSTITVTSTGSGQTSSYVLYHPKK